jgi:hypothetical protein
MSKDKFIVFIINGGAGKNVMATAVVKALKKTNPDSKIIVVTAWKEIWLYNPNVYRTFVFGQTPNFYLDYIKDKDVKICSLEPYATTDYILKNRNLIEIWCNLVGATYDGEKPELFFNSREVEYAANKFNLNNSPIMLIQTNGGGGNQSNKVSWMRDMPLYIANDIVNLYKKNHRILHIRRDDQLPINGVEQFKGNLRELMVLINYSNKRLFIDSVGQHIAAALGKSSTVLWIRNEPSVLGYSIHDNIVTKVEDEIDVLQDSFLEPYDITGNVYQCPFKEGTKLFDLEEIVKSLESQTNK